MKKVLFILLAIFVSASNTKAENTTTNFTFNNGVMLPYDNAVNFIERGVEFYVFPNGEFDFYPLNFNSRNRNLSIVRRNIFGQIRRVGNVRIRYDVFGNVTRIGDVFLRYRRGRLVGVGNLNVGYDRWGTPIFNGAVHNQFFFDNGVRFNLNVGVIYDYNDRFFFRNDFRRNYRQIREDRNFYYYRANRGADLRNNNRIIRRRKANVNNSRRNESITRRNTVRENNFRYRKSNNANTRTNRESTNRERAVNRVSPNRTNNNKVRSGSSVNRDRRINRGNNERINRGRSVNRSDRTQVNRVKPQNSRINRDRNIRNNESNNSRVKRSPSSRVKKSEKVRRSKPVSRAETKSRRTRRN